MSDPEKMQAAVHAYVAAFDKGDPDAVTAIFAPDASVEDPVGAPAHEGYEAIRAFYAESMKTGAKLKLEGPVRIAGNHAAFAFSVALQVEGSDKKIDVIDTFKFNDDNQVVEMRAYFGPLNMQGF